MKQKNKFGLAGLVLLGLVVAGIKGEIKINAHKQNAIVKSAIGCTGMNSAREEYWGLDLNGDGNVDSILVEGRTFTPRAYLPGFYRAKIDNSNTRFLDIYKKMMKTNK